MPGFRFPVHGGGAVHGLRGTLRPGYLHDPAAERACVNTLCHANEPCDALGAGLGIALDIYHVWWDPTLAAEIERAGAERLLAFHLCDWLAPTRDLLSGGPQSLDSLAAFVRWDPMMVFMPPALLASSPGHAPEMTPEARAA